MELVEVAITAGTAPVVQLVEFAVEPEQRPQHRRVKEPHQGEEFVDAVFDGGAGEHESIAAAQSFDGLSGLGVPVLDALGFVEHHNIRPQMLIDIQGVSQHLFVVDDGKERTRSLLAFCSWRAFAAGAGGVIGLQPRQAATVNQLIGEVRKALDLFLPLRLERRGRYDQHTRGLPKPMQQSAGGNGLDGFAQAHFIGQQRAFGERQVQHSLALVREERHLRFVQRPFAALHFLFVFAPEPLALLDAPPRFEPGNQLLRQAQRRKLLCRQFAERIQGVFRRCACQNTIRIEPLLQHRGDAAAIVQQPNRTAS